MQIVKNAAAGTMESSDAYVEIEPAEILEVVRDVLKENGVENASVRVVDRGALECVIRARVETAIHRGKGEA